jgi:hypothetical protein
MPTDRPALDPDQGGRRKSGLDTKRCRIGGWDLVLHFVVRFMKDVLGDNGLEIGVCQGTLDVHASDESEATELAKRQFCEIQRICDWSLHADRIEVRSAEVHRPKD